MEKISQLVENAFRIAWDYLEATGQLGEAESSAKELLQSLHLVKAWPCKPKYDVRYARGEGQVEEVR